MGIILKGKPVADKIKEESIKLLESLREKNIEVRLGIVRIGENPDDIFYEKSLVRYSNGMGIDTDLFNFPLEISESELISKIEDLNDSDAIGGVILLRPFPPHIDDFKIRNTLSYKKDIDGMNSKNLSRIFEGDMEGFLPCTAKAVIEILEYNEVELEGKNVSIINRNMVVGKPLAMMLLDKNATVTICHSKSQNLKDITKASDIVVTATGKSKSLGYEYFNEDSIVIDVGMGLDEDGNLCGDANYKELAERVKMITPVPGGVGSITTSILIKQLIESYIK